MTRGGACQGAPAARRPPRQRRVTGRHARPTLVAHGRGGACRGEEGTQQSTSRYGEGGETFSFVQQSAACSLLSPSVGEKKEKEKEETFSFISSALRLSPYPSEADETAAASGKKCHGFDKFKNYALYLLVE